MGLILPDCFTDDDCPETGFCNDDLICEPYPIVGPGGENPLCSNDSQCQPNQFCDDGICTDFGMGLILPDCFTDDDCPETGFCNDDLICEPYPIVGPGGENPLCSNDSQCQPNQFCDDGFCTDFGMGLILPDCFTDDDCPDTGFCNDNLECQPYPIVGPGGENPLCNIDSQCQPGQFCDAGLCTDFGTGLLIPGEEGDACDEDFECISGVCSAGTCFTPPIVGAF